jgi:hypothetical protein
VARTAARDRVRGRTLRFVFLEGPTSGKAYDHSFDHDCTVTYRDAHDQADGKAAGEKATYAAFRIADGVDLVSYLSPSGYTLTLSLNFDDHEMHGFASNDKQWSPVRGLLEPVG